MAVYGITNEGFVIKPRGQIVTDINNSMLSAFGNSFDISPESPDGQVIGVVADAVYESWLREEAAFNNFIPSKSFGVGLDGLVELNGIKRIIDQPTTVLCTLGGVAATVVPAGSIVETVDGIQFTTDTESIIPSDVNVTAVVLGAVSIAAGEVSVISTANPIAGWTTVTNAAEGTTGVVRQTDPELRSFRSSNTISRGTHTVNAIYQAVANLNLEFIYINDNDTGNTLASGQEPYTINVVVEGGNRQEIAQRIFDNLPAGINAWGATYEVVLDDAGFPHNVGLDSPTDVSVEVATTVIIDPTAASNTLALVQTAIIDYIDSLNIGQDLDWSSLFCPILSVAGVTVSSLTIAKAGDAHGTIPIPIDITEKAVTTPAQVIVTE